jgi:hypothetical protein
MTTTTNTQNVRTATLEDLKTGTVLIDSEGYEHIIADKYADGIWNTRRSSVVFEGEARFYKVKIN